MSSNWAEVKECRHCGRWCWVGPDRDYGWIVRWAELAPLAAGAEALAIVMGWVTVTLTRHGSKHLITSRSDFEMSTRPAGGQGHDVLIVHHQCNADSSPIARGPSGLPPLKVAKADSDEPPY